VVDRHLDDDAYRKLLGLQDELRRFLAWRDSRAASAGISSGQHQLLLSIRGHDHSAGPTIGDVADHLSLRHHSAVELVQRAEAAGLVTRRGDPVDRRAVRLAVSESGRRVLEDLEPLHAEELRRLASDLGPIADGIAAEVPVRSTSAGRRAVAGGVAEGAASISGATGTPAARAAAGAARVRVAHVLDGPDPAAGTRVLVDRIWPRGVRAESAPFEEWLSGVAPTSDLRRWHGDRIERFDELRDRYLAELRVGGDVGLDRLRELCGAGPVTLVTASEDLEHCAARVLADHLATDGP